METSNQLINSAEALPPKQVHVDNASPQYIQQEEQKATTLKQTYYLWISRFFILVSILSMSFLVLASLALFRLAPMVTVEPLLMIKNTNSDSLVETEVISSDMASRDKIMKMFIRRYVEMRNNIIRDPMEMMLRWSRVGMVSFLSDTRVYNEFGARVAPMIETIGNSEFTRETEVTSITRQGGAKSRVWKVDFKTHDLPVQEKNGSRNIVTQYWTASVTAYFNPARAFSFYRLINPLGFTVIRYVQTEVNAF